MEKYHYDGSYPYLLETLEGTRRLSYNVRDALRDYLRVLLPLKITPGSIVLDIGSCIGSLGHHLKYAGVKTFGIDLNSDAVLAGRRMYGWERNNQSLIADGCNLPFANAVFNMVVSQDVFEHLPSTSAAERMLAEINRVLNPKTRRMFHKITVLEDADHIHADASHVLKWTTSEWKKFFEEKGWAVIQSPTRHFPIMSKVSHGNFLLRRM